MRKLTCLRAVAVALVALSIVACERSGSSRKIDAAMDGLPDKSVSEDAANDSGLDGRSSNSDTGAFEVRPATVDTAEAAGKPDLTASSDLAPGGATDTSAAPASTVDGPIADDVLTAVDALPIELDGSLGPMTDVASGEDAAPDSPTATRDDAPPSVPGKSDAPSIDAWAVTVDAVKNQVSDAGTNPGHFSVVVVPNRMLDLIFMIDNSPSMAKKQDKLKAQFPKLIDALKDPLDGTLPDLRVAILDSDLGTGGAYSSGSCGPNTSNGNNNYGDLGKFQMRNATACGVTNSNALWLEYGNGQAVNYAGDINTVFTCLASNLGTMGCGEEHSLQTFEFALVAGGIGNESQHTMLRPGAYLGMVLLTDEDDCSAATNDGLFGDKDTLRGESASLRCATRSHACNGANLADATAPGYPTTAAFSSPFSSCVARTDACPNATEGGSVTDTSVPTACSPLKSVKHMADEIKTLKNRPSDQIFIAGIFGWPLSDADLATATYKIAPVPNPNTADTAHPQVYDYWPVCYDPNHPPSNPDVVTGFDTDAAAWGATGGLRLSAFIDEFGDNGVKFSICQPDYSAAMSKIGGTLSKKLQNLCVPSRGGQYDTCTAHFLIPDSNWNLVEDPTVVPKCSTSTSSSPCYALSSNPGACSGDEYFVEVRQAVDAGPSLPAGTMLAFDCQ
jgi:hypothetical protein